MSNTLLLANEPLYQHYLRTDTVVFNEKNKTTYYEDWQPHIGALLDLVQAPRT
jgi:hypothetical protein